MSQMPLDEIRKEAYHQGYAAALASKQVQGLVKIVEGILDYFVAHDVENKVISGMSLELHEALAPFEKQKGPPMLEGHHSVGLGAKEAARQQAEWEVKYRAARAKEREDAARASKQVQVLVKATRDITSLLQATIAKYVGNGTILTDAEWDKVAGAWAALAPFEKQKEAPDAH